MFKEEQTDGLALLLNKMNSFLNSGRILTKTPLTKVQKDGNQNMIVQDGKNIQHINKS